MAAPARQNSNTYYSDYLLDGNRRITEELLRNRPEYSFELARQRLAQDGPQVGPNGQEIDYNNPVISITTRTADVAIDIIRGSAAVINSYFIAMPIVTLSLGERLATNAYSLIFCDE